MGDVEQVRVRYSRFASPPLSNVANEFLPRIVLYLQDDTSSHSPLSPANSDDSLSESKYVPDDSEPVSCHELLKCKDVWYVCSLYVFSLYVFSLYVCSPYVCSPYVCSKLWPQFLLQLFHLPHYSLQLRLYS